MSIRTMLAAALIVLFLIAGCEGVSPTPVSEATPPTATSLPVPTATSVPPTATPVPSTPTVTPLPPLTGSGGGRITFVSDRDGNNEIYVMNADGTDQRRLTEEAAPDGSPAWSPAPLGGGTSTTWIAFTSQRDGNPEIYVMNADDTDQRRLTRGNDHDWSPAWSPAPLAGGTGGLQIAFTSNRDGNDEIYVMNVDGSDQRRLTRTNKAQDVDPSWSPAPPGGDTSATQIAFVSDRDGNDEIYVMNVDGTNQRRLTHNDADDWWPDWSPDGTQIAFVSDRDGNHEIYVMNADGTDQRRLTDSDADDWWPAWSPDGSQIVFQSNPDGHWDIYIMAVPDGTDADGTDQRRLTTSEANDLEPDWNP